MKRLFGVTIAAALLVGLSMSHLSWSAPKGQPKFLICHATGKDKVEGKIISVAKPALKAHLDHGDCVIAPDPGTQASREVVGTPCNPTPLEGDNPMTPVVEEAGQCASPPPDLDLD